MQLFLEYFKIFVIIWKDTISLTEEKQNLLDKGIPFFLHC